MGFAGFIGIAGHALSEHSKRKRETFRKLRISKRKEYANRADLQRFRSVYEDNKAVNPYSNLSNPFEGLKLDLTKQAGFQRDRYQQESTNLMGNLSGASGASGIAGRIKLLSQMGMDAAQKSASSIQNINPYFAQANAQIQKLERSGRNVTAMFEKGKLENLYNMEWQNMTGYQEHQQKQKDLKKRANERNRALFNQMRGMFGGMSTEGGSLDQFGNAPGPDPNTSALIQNQPWYSSEIHGNFAGGGMPGVSIS